MSLRTMREVAGTAALWIVLAGAACAQDASGGPDKSIAPNSLSGITSGSSNTGSRSPSNASSTNPSHADPSPMTTDGVDNRAGNTPQGRNNTMDDSGTGSSGPGEGTQR
jgi:hypothetical protein